MILGDLNLSHRHEEDQEKIKVLCDEGRVSALTEITRAASNNQLDYILINKILSRSCFVTAYNNFISDHKAITLRINLNKNPILDKIKERITFDEESHQKPKKSQLQETSTDDFSSEKSETSSQSSEEIQHISSPDSETEDNQIFKRRIMNPDMATCWLNSCLQLLLSAMDHQLPDIHFNSELGTELRNLQINASGGYLDPTGVKNIIVTCEDTRIALRLSELQAEIFHPDDLERQSRLVESFRLDLSKGQQCVRDFFVALNQNLVNWPDVYNLFSFEIVTSTTCQRCKNLSQSETLQIYEEMQVPVDQSNSKFHIEEFFNGSTTVESNCRRCKEVGPGERRTRLKSCRESKFIILIFSRAIQAEHGYQLVQNNVTSTDPVLIRLESFHFLLIIIRF